MDTMAKSLNLPIGDDFYIELLEGLYGAGNQSEVV